MATLKQKDVWFRIGDQSNRTTVASTLVDIVPPADNIDFVEDFATEDLDTDHGASGTLFTVVTSKNFEKKRLNTYIYPTNVGYFLNGAVSRDATSGELTYKTVEKWWGSALGGTEDKGIRFFGCLFDGFSLTIDRGGKSEPLQISMDCFVNAQKRILTGETAPAKDWPKAAPYQSSGALIDFVRDTGSGSYGPDDADVKRVSITFGNSASVEQIADNETDIDYDKVWTVHAPGEAKAQISVTCRITEDEYLRLGKAATPTIGAIRVALKHPKATSITTASTITSGDNNDQTLNVSSTTGFLVGDVCVITHPTTGFTTLPIKTVNAGVSLVFDTDTGGGSGKDSRVTLNGSVDALTIRNMGVGIIFDAMTYKGRGSDVRDGAFRVVELRYEAKLSAGATKIVEVHAYNHSNARIS
ncbi:MAG: hypothetical protein E6Q97_06080 [Desulfurellales bacterium]|nr:MAG: hypothetical protein E6Q97_06080 [Desulfurellales bacterium]